jgi:hypothetical protein
MTKINKNILLEGRYDSFTRRISNDIMRSIKSTENNSDDDTTFFELPYDESGGDNYTHESGLSIPVDLRVRRINDTILYGDKELPYYIKSYVSDDDFLVMEVIIDNTYGKNFYQEMFYKINEDIRHEMEHFLQDILPNRQKSNVPNTADYETVFDHHMDPSEVEALTHGFYRRAKLEKKPLDVVMMSDIEKDITDGNITTEEGDILLQTWLKYAFENLPHANYSDDIKRRVVFQK